MMQIIRVKDYEEMSCRGAALIAQQITDRKQSVLGLATGSTPIGTYRKLSEFCMEGKLDFSEVTTINLDEYLGLSPEHPQSYRYFMNENLFSHINIRQENTHVPCGDADDVQAACRAYDEMIELLGGIDLQLLGLGHNGHIGFNEPADVFVKETHVIDLSERTIRANSRLFRSEEEVPGKAVTVGLGAIMGARRILLLVSGEDKAPALHAALHGPITPRLPGSILQLHPDVTVIADEAALQEEP